MKLFFGARERREKKAQTLITYQQLVAHNRWNIFCFFFSQYILLYSYLDFGMIVIIYGPICIVTELFAKKKKCSIKKQPFGGHYQDIPHSIVEIKLDFRVWKEFIGQVYALYSASSSDMLFQQNSTSKVKLNG